MHQPELVSPNLHVILVHYPLALLVTGVLIELFSFMWRRHAFRAAGRWMILLGALTAIPTTMSGIFALHDVATRGLEQSQMSGAWKDVAPLSPLDAQQWETLTWHLRLEVCATALSVPLVILWIACSDGGRATLHFPILLLLLASVGLAAAGAWYGGEAVYRHRIGVAMDTTQAVRDRAATTGVSSTTTAATTSSGSEEKIADSFVPKGADVIFFIPPIQLHLILAGMTISIALAALALSTHKISQGDPSTHMDHIAAALGGETPDTLITDGQDIGQPRIPSARFWMLAFLITLLTAGAGYWMLALHEHSWSVNDLWKGVIAENMHNGQWRQIAHIIAGGSIALLALILAMLARWGPRQKFLLGLFALALIAIVAIQIWFGILLLYDTRLGPLNKFN